LYFKKLKNGTINDFFYTKTFGMKTNTKIFIAISSIINALFMLALSIFLLNQPIVHNDEKVLIKQTVEYKEKFMGEDKKPSPDDFLFINISYNKEFCSVI
jgi:hypothetical protein